METNPTYLVIADDGAQYGPLTESELRLWIQERRVGAQNQTWLEGTAQWKPLAEQPAFRASFAPPPPPAGRPGAVKGSVWTKPMLETPGEALARDLAKDSKHPKLMRYVWQGTVALVVGVGILLSRMNWTSTASLETQVRKSIEENFRKNLNTRGTQVLTFHLVHEGGSRYKGTLGAMTALKTETVEVDVTYDGRAFEWKIVPAASPPAPAVADEQPEPQAVPVARQPVREAAPAPEITRAEFNTTDKSVEENGNLIVAVRRIQAGVPKTHNTDSVEDVTKNPYAALGKVFELTGEVYKVEARAPDPAVKGQWTDILILVPNDNSPQGATTVDFICQGDLSNVNAGDAVTFSGYFIGTYQSKNAMGGTVEGLGMVGDSMRRAAPAR